MIAEILILVNGDEIKIAKAEKVNIPDMSGIIPEEIWEYKECHIPHETFKSILYWYKEGGTGSIYITMQSGAEIRVLSNSGIVNRLKSLD